MEKITYREKTTLVNITKIIILFLVLSSCKNKNIEHINDETTQPDQIDYLQTFIEMNKDKPEMIYSIEYYKNMIIEKKQNFDDRQEISAILEIKNIIPGLLCFLVCWDDNLKGYIYELYAFNKNQNIVRKYLVGYGPKIYNYRNVLMEKLPGTKTERELIAFGDFNNDGICEILSYSFYTQIGYVFTVFGYSFTENDFVPTCLVPIYINFENPFSPVEYIGNGFKILEVIDDEYLELAWNKYTWESDKMKYIKQ